MVRKGAREQRGKKRGNALAALAVANALGLVMTRKRRTQSAQKNCAKVDPRLHFVKAVAGWQIRPTIQPSKRNLRAILEEACARRASQRARRRRIERPVRAASSVGNLVGARRARNSTSSRKPHPAGPKARKRKRERVRCSSLIDWPVSPRPSGRTMQGSECRADSGGVRVAARPGFSVSFRWLRKSERLAHNMRKTGDDGGSGSSRFPANRTYRVSVFDLAISAFLLGAHGLTSLASAGITPGLYAFRLGGGTKSAATFRA